MPDRFIMGGLMHLFDNITKLITLYLHVLIGMTASSKDQSNDE